MQVLLQPGRDAGRLRGSCRRRCPCAARVSRRHLLAGTRGRSASREGEIHDLCWCGAWETALAEAQEVDAYLAAQDRRYDLQRLRATVALLRTWRGSPESAKPAAIWAEEASRTTDEPGARAASLLGLTVVSEALGDEAATRRLLYEVADLPVPRPGCTRTMCSACRLRCAARSPWTPQSSPCTWPTACPTTAPGTTACD